MYCAALQSLGLGLGVGVGVGLGLGLPPEGGMAAAMSAACSWGSSAWQE